VVEAVIDRRILNETIPVCVPEITTRYGLANDILSEFGIVVTSEDRQDMTPVFADDDRSSGNWACQDVLMRR